MPQQERRSEEGIGRTQEGEVEGKEWRRQRRDYRNFLDSKKRRKNKEWLELLEKDKGMKLFW